MSNQDLRRIFAENLNAYMDSHGVSKSDLAQRLDIAKSTVTSWCSGEKSPRMEKIEAIAAVLGCSAGDLMSRREEDDLKSLLSARPECRQLLEVALRCPPEEVRRLIKVAEAFTAEN